MSRNLAVAVLVGSSLAAAPARGAPQGRESEATSTADARRPLDSAARPRRAGDAVYRGVPGSLSDEKRYAAREAQSPQAKNFRAGDVVVISASAVAIVLLVVVIILLL